MVLWEDVRGKYNIWEGREGASEETTQEVNQVKGEKSLSFQEESRYKGPVLGDLLQLWDAQRRPVWLEQREQSVSSKCGWEVVGVRVEGLCWLGKGLGIYSKNPLRVPSAR